MIDISLSERLKAGSHTSTVSSKEKDSSTAFKLRLKGEMPELAEPKVDPSMVPRADDGTPQSPEKKVKKVCEIDVSLQERIAAGSITTTVREAKLDEPV